MGQRDAKSFQELPNGMTYCSRKRYIKTTRIICASLNTLRKPSISSAGHFKHIEIAARMITSQMSALYQQQVQV